MERDKSIIDQLAGKGDPHAIAEQRKRNILYRKASLGDEEAIQQLKDNGWTEADLLANQAIEFVTMGMKEKANSAWDKLKNLLNKQ